MILAGASPLVGSPLQHSPLVETPTRRGPGSVTPDSSQSDVDIVLLDAAGSNGAQMPPPSVGGPLRGKGLKQAVLAASCGTFALGYNTGIAAGAMLYIRDDEAFAPLSGLEEGALVSCVLAGATLGAALGPLSDRLGRRGALLGSAAIFVVGGVAMALAPGTIALLWARGLTGVAVGQASGLVNLYIAEIAPADVRGQLGGWAPFLGTTGILVSYVVSALLGLLPGGAWRIQLGLGALPGVVQLLLTRLQPESPRWLLARGKSAKAREVLERLFDETPSFVLDAELDRLQTEVSLRQSSQQVGIMTLFGKYSGGAFLGIGINVLQQVSGINVVIYYGSTVLQIVGLDDTASMIALSTMTALQLCATAVLIRFVDKYGRRPLALWGLIFMVFGLITLVIAFLSDGAPWAAPVTIASVLVYRMAFSLSLGPLPYIMTSEFFPQEARAAGVAVSWTSNWAANFAVSLLFPISNEWFSEMLGASIGPAAIFGIYAVFCVVAFCFCLRFLPETSGVQLEDCSPRKLRAPAPGQPAHEASKESHLEPPSERFDSFEPAA